MTFEESMKKLEEMSVKIKSKDTTLDDAIKCYEEGIEAYHTCNRILNDAQQKIEVFRA